MKKRGLNLPKERKVTGPASLWKRFVAFVIDILVIQFVIALPFRGIFKIVPVGGIKETYEYLQAHPSVNLKINIATIVVGLLALLYFAILEFKIQQTIGKMFMNIQVKSITKRLTFWQCLVRSMCFILIFPFILLWIIDPIFMVFNKENNRLSEILSKTRVVEEYII